MRKIEISIVIFIFVFAVACNRHQNNVVHKETIVVDADQKKDFQLSELSGDINIIDLNNNASDIIGEISAIKTFGDFVYVFDSQSNSLICYNRKSGNHHFTINSQGRGPDELQMITDFIVNPFGNFIEIMDAGNRKIVKFSLDGDYISERPTGYLGHYFEALNPSDYVIYSNYQVNEHSSNLYIIDAIENELKKKLLPISDAYENFSLLYHVHFNQSKNQGLLFSEMHDNKIYCITPDSLRVKYEIDFKDNNVPEKLKQELNDNPPPFNQKIYLDKLFESSYCHSVHSFFESEKVTGFLFTQNNEQKVFLKRNSNGESYVINKFLLDNGIVLDGSVLLIKDDCIYMVINSLAMVRYREELHKKFSKLEIEEQNKHPHSFVSDLNRISKKAGVDDNPYLLEIKIKL